MTLLKPINLHIADLQVEYLEIKGRLDKARFALNTLPLDEEEKNDLNDQIWSMEGYADRLLKRAAYAAKKRDLKD